MSLVTRIVVQRPNEVFTSQILWPVAPARALLILEVNVKSL